MLIGRFLAPDSAALRADLLCFLDAVMRGGLPHPWMDGNRFADTVAVEPAAHSVRNLHERTLLPEPTLKESEVEPSTPREKDKLLIAMAAQVARRRLERGVKLNHPEAVALITDFVVEGARDGRKRRGTDARRRQVLKATRSWRASPR